MAATEEKRMIVGLDIGTSKVVAVVGEIDSDGYEWIEHPVASDIWYWRGSESNDWELYEE